VGTHNGPLAYRPQAATAAAGQGASDAVRCVEAVTRVCDARRVRGAGGRLRSGPKDPSASSSVWGSGIGWGVILIIIFNISVFLIQIFIITNVTVFLFINFERPSTSIFFSGGCRAWSLSRGEAIGPPRTCRLAFPLATCERARTVTDDGLLTSCPQMDGVARTRSTRERGER
jgi:hypothetical protein